MTLHEYCLARDHILAAAEVLAPKAPFWDLATEMEKEGEPHKVILLRLAGAIFDGLAYGNWPSL